MKQIYILAVILFCNCIYLNAQTVDVVKGLTDPRGMIFIENDLYICESLQISKIDITATTPTATDVVTGLGGPQGLTINGNDLYISDSVIDKILKLDLTTLSIGNLPVINSIKLYPNPSNDFIQITGLTQKKITRFIMC